jgi:hypothetical protein
MKIGTYRKKTLKIDHQVLKKSLRISDSGGRMARVTGSGIWRGSSESFTGCRR